MFTPFCSTDLDSVSLKDKRILLTVLKEAIKTDVILSKTNRIIAKQAKENAQRDKVNEQIRIATEKLAKLQLKLAS